MEELDHDGRTTVYRDATTETEGPRTLYVHGSGATHTVWAKQYGRPNHDAVALDLSGHGDSEDVPLDADAGLDAMAAYADDVVAVARETGASVLCGNSLGGAVIQWVALERDLDLDGLVLVGTGAKLGVAPELLDLLSGDFEAAVDTLMGADMLFHETPEGAAEDAREAFFAVGQRVTERDFRACNAFDVRDRLGEIDVPALVVNGEHDSLTLPDFHAYLAEHLPDARRVEIADAAHMPYVERPAPFDTAVDEFLATLAD
jgi:pimeloyl-ACP methyl ester carboxylesterase